MPKLRFGPAGKPVDYKKTDITGVPEFLHSIGLNAFEYQAVRGVKISEEKARRLGEEAKKYDVLLSMHGPYYINFGSPEKKIFEASIKRLEDSIQACKWMEAYIVVFHPGYYKGTTPEEAVKRTIEALKIVDEFRKSIGAKNVWLGPETTGKVTQIGTLEENIEICRNIDNCKPVVDWAHMYARSQGKYITTIDHVIEVITMIEKELGKNAVSPLHMHFSKIDYGKGGEKEHHTLAEEGYGPDFRIICKGLVEVGVDGVIISESPILEKDAIVMKNICKEICGAECIAD
ncbi:TIM barrel protein [Desulfurococcaceae archaeon MEX13E-LK6-19]|nr:TIM barrel protein [Desulfurococcaceae archaeon MEX13E-LK6-19]